VSSSAVCVAASWLLTGLIGDESGDGDLVEVARTRSSVHYETGRSDVPVLCLSGPGALRLPNCMITPVLPSGALRCRDGVLASADAAWRVTRWWRPPRPRGLSAPPYLPDLPGVEVPGTIRPLDLVGAGPGLTPTGDDVLAGALVAAHATADPRLERWRAETRTALRERGTTAVSRGLLVHALDGWATPELADFVIALCGGDATAAAPRLLAVGHRSGAALAAGALHALRRPLSVTRGAA
jgi:Protein of unknown function (DUF2877)